MVFYPYRYIKKEPGSPKNLNRIKRRFIGGILTGAGIISTLTFIIAPLSKSYLSDTFRSSIVSAVTEDFFKESFEIKKLTALDISKKNFKNTKVLGDITVIKKEQKKEGPSQFYVSIPSLGISKARVDANTTNLDPADALAHILGTEVPGSTGNVFITGHSTFKYLFNPDDYKTIFANLDEIQINDLIIIDYGKEKFRYVVTQKEILKPEDVSLYKENYPSFLNKQTTTLMTCFPPGTTQYRLLVTAELVD